MAEGGAIQGSTQKKGLFEGSSVQVVRVVQAVGNGSFPMIIVMSSSPPLGPKVILLDFSLE